MASKPTSHIGGRSAVTGKFVTLQYTRQHPNTTVRERIPNPGHGESGKKK